MGEMPITMFLTKFRKGDPASKINIIYFILINILYFNKIILIFFVLSFEIKI